ncbi:uncharacterized protein LOC120358103 [Solenopsis invicta]|uniref:uncharacterized protein LOC120358103 n=1 Tax=Solenopsis invicta TaxID=13686 RepID=UPI00193E0DB9|nr:uncharacterized protein LOC120358103 [Solenopsis invicta]
MGKRKKKVPPRGDRTPQSRHGGAMVPGPPLSSSNDGRSSGVPPGSADYRATGGADVLDSKWSAKDMERIVRIIRLSSFMSRGYEGSDEESDEGGNVSPPNGGSGVEPAQRAVAPIPDDGEGTASLLRRATRGRAGREGRGPRASHWGVSDPSPGGRREADAGGRGLGGGRVARSPCLRTGWSADAVRRKPDSLAGTRISDVRRPDFSRACAAMTSHSNDVLCFGRYGCKRQKRGYIYNFLRYLSDTTFTAHAREKSGHLSSLTRMRTDRARARRSASAEAARRARVGTTHPVN